MRECSQCLAEILNDADAVCASCGAALAPIAVGGAEGAPAPGAEPPAALSEEAVHFRRQFEERAMHVPEQALRRAEEILSSAGTELRRATVLMVDLVGFSRAGTELTAEGLSRLAADFYRICSQCIIRRGGFVVKFIGDAALSVFGAPMAFDRDTENAVYAALDIRERIAQTRLGEGRAMAVSIGLATGPLQSGLIEMPSGKTYDVLGDTVNLAARLQSAAGADNIFVCAETREATARQFESEPTQPLKLKNISDAYVAHRILDERSQPLPRRVFDTPFCGREGDLAALAQLLAAPGSQAAHVAGEAGLGKSRLIHEALRRAGAGERAVWWEAAPATSSILLHPVLEWLRSEIGVSPDDPSDAIREGISRYLASRLPREDADPLLLEYLFGVPRAIAALQGTPPERIQRNLFALLRQLILSSRPGDSSHAILVADDVQWADPLTLKFLKALVEWPTNGELGIADWGLRIEDRAGQTGENRRPAGSDSQSSQIPNPEDKSAIRNPQSAITLVFVYRTSAEPPVAPRPDDLQIHLKPLTEKERDTLLGQIISPEEFTPEIKDLIFTKASGNPLFLEEMIRLLQRLLSEQPSLDAAKLKRDIIAVLPTSLRDLIQSRIDRLDLRARQVLQCASLLGVEFAFTLIEMFDVIRDGLAGHLHALRAMSYLDEHPGARDERDIYYFFIHGLFRDVAYATLLEEQKRQLHLTLARKLERTFADRLQEYYELLAFHFSRGGDAPKAIYYLVKAADRQMGLGAASNALENYSEAIEMLRAAPPIPANQVLMARVLTRCGGLHRVMGASDEAEAMLAAALDCAATLANERLALEARLGRAVVALMKGQNTLAPETMDALIRDAVRLRNPKAEMVAHNILGVMREHRGEIEEALRAFETVAALAAKNDAAHVEADAWNNAGHMYSRQGRYAQALETLRRALALRHKANDRFGLCATIMNIGIVQERLGQVAAARESYHNALRLAEKTGYVQALAALESNLSNLERNVGTLAAAQEHASRAIAYARHAHDSILEAAAEENLALAFALQGDGEAARLHFASALDIARRNGLSEKRIGVRLYMLLYGCDEEPAGAKALEEADALISEIEQKGYSGLKPRAWRARARTLGLVQPGREAEEAEWLAKACEMARSAGNVFEELESLTAFAACCRRRGDELLYTEANERMEAIRRTLD